MELRECKPMVASITRRACIVNKMKKSILCQGCKGLGPAISKGEVSMSADLIINPGKVPGKRGRKPGWNKPKELQMDSGVPAKGVSVVIPDKILTDEPFRASNQPIVSGNTEPDVLDDLLKGMSDEFMLHISPALQGRMKEARITPARVVLLVEKLLDGKLRHR